MIALGAKLAVTIDSSVQTVYVYTLHDPLGDLFAKLL